MAMCLAPANNLLAAGATIPGGGVPQITENLNY